MQAKCTAARAQVNMLCTHTDTPGRSRGLRRWEGDRAVSPGTTDTRTHIHTAAPAGSARGLGTRWGCRAQTQRVLTARHGTETWTWSLGTELEEELVSERGRGNPAPPWHVGTGRGQLGRSRGLPAVRCAAGGRGKDRAPLCLWLVFLVFLLRGLLVALPLRLQQRLNQRLFHSLLGHLLGLGVKRAVSSTHASPKGLLLGEELPEGPGRDQLHAHMGWDTARMEMIGGEVGTLAGHPVLTAAHRAGKGQESDCGSAHPRNAHPQDA